MRRKRLIMIGYLITEIKLNVLDDRLAYIFKIEENGELYYFSEDGIRRL